jgi:hypothetical protein
MRILTRAVLAAGFLLFAPPLAAQGFWFGAGVGTGVQRVGCDICRGHMDGGWAARVAMGGTISSHLRIGAELHGWTDRTEDIRFRSYSLMPALYWYPSTRTPYFFVGALGLMGYRASDGSESLSSSSLGLTAGAGYEMPLSPGFAIAPFFTYTGSILANLKHDRTDITGAQFSLFQLGFALMRR